MASPVTEPTRSGPAALRVRGLSVSYGPLAALRDVDLDVGPGEIVGIAGDNGAGKSTLLRCICGDLGYARGGVWRDGERMVSRPPSDSRGRLGVVWQHLVLCDNLDAAANLMLGRERRGLLASDARFHARARALLDDLGITIADLGRPVWTLTNGERQLLAIARSVSPRPRLLLLDEPTAALGRAESAHVEGLIRRFHDEGTTIVLISHDVEQLFRLTERVLVLRRGEIVGQVVPAESHPDEVLALMSGHDPSSAPRHQLTRLQGLADQLTSSDRPASDDPSVGLTLILSTLGAALGAEQLSLHLLEETTLSCPCSVGLTRPLEEAWRALPLAAAPAPLARAVADGTAVVEADVAGNDSLRASRGLLAEAGIASWWAVPFSGPRGVSGVISVYRPLVGSPSRDELDLVNVYAGYAAGAVERDRLVAEQTARNRLLETIRSVLQTLAGPGSLADGLAAALRSLREAVGADVVGLYSRAEGGQTSARAVAAAPGRDPRAPLDAALDAALDQPPDAGPGQVQTEGRGSRLLVRLPEAAPATVLAVAWTTRVATTDDRLLCEDAGHSILLALERERAERAHRETSALRRSQELQRQFLARLSHELRTPLTAIRGYASSLMQTDVTWDAGSQQRFLSRISSESARLRRLVDDLLDFSLIESGMLHLRPDWVDLPLVIDAARSCLSPRAATAVEVRSTADLPVIWADHDRLEQVLMNLMDNAVRHNPPGTAVRVLARRDGPDRVLLEVSDDGVGLPGSPDEVALPGSHDGAARPDSHDEVALSGSHDEGAHSISRGRPRGATAGAGLGLSITRAIVEAHRGTLRRGPTERGTRFLVHLPVEAEELVEVTDG